MADLLSALVDSNTLPLDDDDNTNKNASRISIQGTSEGTGPLNLHHFTDSTSCTSQIT